MPWIINQHAETSTTNQEQKRGLYSQVYWEYKSLDEFNLKTVAEQRGFLPRFSRVSFLNS